MATKIDSEKINLITEEAEPFLKWAGGKRQLLDQLTESAPESFNTYYEPMLGAGALFFHLQPEKSIINDINEDLMITFKGVRDHVKEIIALLKEYKKKHGEDFYYDQRDSFNKLKKKGNESDTVERAALFIYLNRTCYNGLYRVNSKGEFNAPFGKYDNPTICFEKRLKAVSKVLENAEIKCEDYDQNVVDAEENDFIYFDPPYDPVSETANFTGYTDSGFDKEEQERLADTFKDLDSKNCKVMLSNSNTDFINELYKDFNIHVVGANRCINSNSKDRGEVKEVIITNY